MNLYRTYQFRSSGAIQQFFIADDQRKAPQAAAKRSISDWMPVSLRETKYCLLQTALHVQGCAEILFWRVILQVGTIWTSVRMRRKSHQWWSVCSRHGVHDREQPRRFQTWLKLEHRVTSCHLSAQSDQTEHRQIRRASISSYSTTVW